MKKLLTFLLLSLAVANTSYANERSDIKRLLSDPATQQTVNRLLDEVSNGKGETRECTGSICAGCIDGEKIKGCYINLCSDSENSHCASCSVTTEHGIKCLLW